jgi:hypothetical protein
MKRLAILLVVLSVGCQTARRSGSVYKQTGRISDLLVEPTFDVGRGPPENSFYDFRVRHYNADGHGAFDVPIVVIEQFLFSPVWVFSAALQITGISPHLWAPPPAASGPTALFSMVNWVLSLVEGWCVGIPAMLCYYGCFAATMVFDIVAHDLPVIVVGAPFRKGKKSDSTEALKE